jgi:hypothetical protein
MRQRLLLALGLLVLTSGTAWAQTQVESSADISAGYRFLQSNGTSYPAGWYFDLTRHVNRVVSITGDVGGAYKGDSVSAGNFSQSLDARIHTFMGGVKVRAVTQNPDVIAFGQALFGAANLRMTTTALGITLSRKTTEPAVSFGAGVDVNDFVVDLRFQITWLRVFEDDGSNAFLFSVGAKFDL